LGIHNRPFRRTRAQPRQKLPETMNGAGPATGAGRDCGV